MGVYMPDGSVFLFGEHTAVMRGCRQRSVKGHQLFGEPWLFLQGSRPPTLHDAPHTLDLFYDLVWSRIGGSCGECLTRNVSTMI